MRNSRTALAALLFAVSGLSLATEVVVLRGGARIDLKSPVETQGQTALLTRADGTLLSIRISEIDWKATAAARSSKPAPVKPLIVAPPSAPADAVRSGRGEKARVRVTDADVGHVESPSGAAERERGVEAHAGASRVEVGEYTQQKNGNSLIISGTLRNPGTTPVTSTRLVVSAVDENGVTVSSASATVGNGTIEGGRSVAFSATVPVGDRTIAQIRFAPQWMTPPTPVAPGAAPVASAAPAAASPAPPAGAPASKPPAPAPTPYGLGTLYAAPPMSAPSTPPADGRTGYIPGAASPENQPHPPQ